jgi:hypothetical protein
MSVEFGDPHLRSLPLLLPMPSNRSRQSATRVATVVWLAMKRNATVRVSPFHSKPSCNRKNSLKAGSSDNWLSFFGVDSCCSPMLIDEAFLRWPGVEGFDLPLERHIWASMPSIWRSPFRIFCVSLDAMLSNASESSASISRSSYECCGKLVGARLGVVRRWRCQFERDGNKLSWTGRCRRRQAARYGVHAANISRSRSISSVVGREIGVMMTCPKHVGPRLVAEATSPPTWTCALANAVALRQPPP